MCAKVSKSIGKNESEEGKNALLLPILKFFTLAATVKVGK